jgi:hypothetical protein
VTLILLEKVPHLHGCLDVAVSTAEAHAFNWIVIAGFDKARQTITTVFKCGKRVPGCGVASGPTEEAGVGAVVVVEMGQRLGISPATRKRLPD